MDQLQYLTDHLATDKHAPNAKTGYAVAMEVKTGKVIAMASMPDYDPNIWEGGSICTDDYNAIKYVLQNGTISPVIGPYDDPKEQRKHPSSIVFLGSTQKPLSVLIGLNEKLFTTNEHLYGHRGVLLRQRRRTRAAGSAMRRGMPTERWTLDGDRPILQSVHGQDGRQCAVLKRRRKKGVDIWDNYVKQFGLGVCTGSGLPEREQGRYRLFRRARSERARSPR